MLLWVLLGCSSAGIHVETGGTWSKADHPLQCVWGSIQSVEGPIEQCDLPEQGFHWQTALGREL